MIMSDYSKPVKKEYKKKHDWVWRGDPLRIVQDIEI